MLKKLFKLEASPLNKRRLQNFKANKRGYYSFWVFLILFLLSLPAEFISNDNPIIVKYNGNFYFPVFIEYPESEFGGFLAQTDYRDPFITEEIESKGWIMWPPFKYGHNTINKIPGTTAPSPPSKENPLGTDNQSRDVLARLIYGFRISILFGLILTFFSSIIGIAAGAVQGFFGGKIDLFFQRFIEIWGGLPMLFILIILASIFESSFFMMLIILLLFTWPGLTAVVRAEFLRARNFDYVRAARALGVGNIAIMWRHVLPNAMVAAVTFLPFTLIGSITLLTALDFLGFGLPPGSASLGELLAQGRANTQAPWLGLTGFSVMAITLILIIFIGEAVRDAFDPKKVQI
jgi:microcin C transport system permease protein